MICKCLGARLLEFQVDLPLKSDSALSAVSAGNETFPRMWRRSSLWRWASSPVRGFRFSCTGKCAAWKVPDGAGTAKRAAQQTTRVLRLRNGIIYDIISTWLSRFKSMFWRLGASDVLRSRIPCVSRTRWCFPCHPSLRRRQGFPDARCRSRKIILA